MSQGYLDWYLTTSGEKLPLVFTDNQSALAMANSTLVNKRSKHIDLRYHMVKDHVKDLCYCHTDRNLADPLTKPLVSAKYLSLFQVDPNSQISDTVRSFYVAI